MLRLFYSLFPQMKKSLSISLLSTHLYHQHRHHHHYYYYCWRIILHLSFCGIRWKQEHLRKYTSILETTRREMSADFFALNKDIKEEDGFQWTFDLILKENEWKPESTWKWCAKRQFQKMKPVYFVIQQKK